MRSLFLSIALVWMFAGEIPGQTQRRFDAFRFLAPTSYVGLGIADIDSAKADSIGLIEPHGVEVMDVASNSPAERAGLKRSDVVLTFQGTHIVGLEQFARMVSETPVGREVLLGVFRDGSERSIRVEVGERPNLVKRVKACENCPPGTQVFQFGRQALDMPRSRLVVHSGLLGAELEAVDGQFAGFFGVSNGVLVRTVRQSSPADSAGMAAGDIIISVGGKPVARTQEVSRALTSSRSGRVSVEVMRDRQKRTIEVERAVSGQPGMTRRVTAPR
jgi:serine protease Do